MTVEKWNDDRLDELNRRVINVENVGTTVAVVQAKLQTLEHGMSAANKGIGDLSRKLTQVVDEPMVRARDFRSQMLQGVVAAIAGGTIVFLATLLAGSLH